MPPDAAIKDLILALDSDDWRSRWNAVRDLGELKAVPAVTKISACLDDPDADIRLAAEEALLKIASPEALDSVAEHRRRHAEKGRAALLDRSRPLDVRLASLAALWEQKPQGLDSILLDCICEPDEQLQRKAFEHLATIAAPNHIPILIDKLSHPDTGIRELALSALQRYRGQFDPQLLASFVTPHPQPASGSPPIDARFFNRVLGLLEDSRHKDDRKPIEVEADTLEEARAQLRSQIPAVCYVLSERVISDGRPQTATAVADTVEAALARAEGEVPPNATVLDKKQVTLPGQKTMRVEAFDEASARALVQSKIGDTETVHSVKLTVPGRKGFLGVGKTAHHYEAVVSQRAVAAIIYTQRARVSAEIGLGKRPVLVVLRDFCVAKAGEMEAAEMAARMMGTSGVGGFSPLEFLDLLRDLINSEFSQTQVQRALHHRSGLARRLVAEFLAEVTKWC
jgi:hypothetical protein